MWLLAFARWTLPEKNAIIGVCECLCVCVSEGVFAGKGEQKRRSEGWRRADTYGCVREYVSGAD